MMKTLVLPPRYTADSIAMSQSAARLGWRVERLTNWRVPHELRGTGATIFGEPLFATVVSGPLGTALLEPSHSWLPDVPAGYRRRSVHLTTAGEARQLIAPTFIKPVSEKWFAAKVYASGAELPPTCDLDDSELVLLSEPVVWQIEFRAFVLDRKIVALSPYLRDGQLAQQADGTWLAEAEETEAAEAFLRAVLADDGLRVPPAFVLDVGTIVDRGWAVIEANAAWGSGLYGCDPAAVLGVVSRACVPKGCVQDGDMPWLRKASVMVD